MTTATMQHSELMPDVASPDLAKINDKYREIARLIVMGLSNVDIAARMDCHPTTISIIRHKPYVRQHIMELHGGRDDQSSFITERIRNLASQAVDVMETMMMDEDTPAPVRASLSKDILDRAGHGAVTKSVSFSGKMSQDDIEEIKRRAREAGATSGVIIDVKGER